VSKVVLISDPFIPAGEPKPRKRGSQNDQKGVKKWSKNPKYDPKNPDLDPKRSDFDLESRFLEVKTILAPLN